MSPTDSNHSFDRRSLLIAGGVGAAGAIAAGSLPSSADGHARDQSSSTVSGKTLRFSDDGKFKVVQFNDTQDDHNTDRRTIETLERIIDSEQPDFVIINGDVIEAGMKTAKQVRQAINNVVMPMESRRIPWAVTFGNHDEDTLAATGMTEAKQLDYYRTYTHNTNAANIDGLRSTSPTTLLIGSGRSRRESAFALWLLDSGRYAPNPFNGQDIAGYPNWDWLRMDEVAWYRDRSRQLERRLGRKLPGLMFMHIALWEFRFMWWGGVDTRTPTDRERGQRRHGIVGERNEDECPGPFNSGMFNALLERGDVQGVFVGHDHINSYVGDYYGIRLGYGPGTGFRPYGLPGAERNRMRGARVFELTETEDGVTWTTRLRFASEFGVDLTANAQPAPPYLLPEEIGSLRPRVRVDMSRRSARPGERVEIVATVAGENGQAPQGWANLFIGGSARGRVDLEGGTGRFEATVPDARGHVAVEVAYGGDTRHRRQSAQARLVVR